MLSHLRRTRFWRRTSGGSSRTKRNRQYHNLIDGTVEEEVLEHLERIKIYPVEIASEDDLLKEIARVANLSMMLGYKLERENRPLTKEEAYVQLGHSASVLRAILRQNK